MKRILKFRSIFLNVTDQIHCFILKKLTSDFSLYVIDITIWKILLDIQLIDPNFNAFGMINLFFKE